MTISFMIVVNLSLFVIHIRSKSALEIWSKTLSFYFEAATTLPSITVLKWYQFNQKNDHRSIPMYKMLTINRKKALESVFSLFPNSFVKCFFVITGFPRYSLPYNFLWMWIAKLRIPSQAYCKDKGLGSTKFECE